MDQEGDNENYEYYEPIQTRLGRRIVKPNRFGQEDAIEIGILNCQCNAFLQNSWLGSIETIKNE